MDDFLDLVFEEDDVDGSFDLELDGESLVEESGDDFVHLDTAPNDPYLKDSVQRQLRDSFA